MRTLTSDMNSSLQADGASAALQSEAGVGCCREDDADGLPDSGHELLIPQRMSGHHRAVPVTKISESFREHSAFYKGGQV